MLDDPFGHRWNIATHIEDVPPDEIERRATEVPGGSKPGRAALGPDGNLRIAAFGNTYDAQNTTNQIHPADAIGRADVVRAAARTR